MAAASTMRRPRKGRLLSSALRSTKYRQNMKAPATSGTVALSSRRTGTDSTIAPTSAVAAQILRAMSGATAGATQRVKTYAPAVPATMNPRKPDQVFSRFQGSAGPRSAPPVTLAVPSPNAMMAQVAPTMCRSWR